MRYFILFLTLFSSIQSLAGTADLSVILEYEDTNGIVLDRQGEITFIITNNGPDIAADGVPGNPIAVLSNTIQDNGSFTPEIEFAPAIGNDPRCNILLTIGDPPPGGSVVYAYTITLPPLDVNQTITCRAVFSRNFMSGTREVSWTSFNNFDVDPDSSNDSQTIVFGIPPRSVPLDNPLFLIGLLLLVLYYGRNKI